MAEKPATAAANALPPAMDYAQHNATYHAFLNFVKYATAALALVMLALYAFIEGHQPILGTILLLLVPVGAVGLVVMRSRRR